MWAGLCGLLSDASELQGERLERGLLDLWDALQGLVQLWGCDIYPPHMDPQERLWGGAIPYKALNEALVRVDFWVILG